MVTVWGDLQPDSLADRLLTGPGAPEQLRQLTTDRILSLRADRKISANSGKTSRSSTTRTPGLSRMPSSGRHQGIHFGNYRFLNHQPKSATAKLHK